MYGKAVRADGKSYEIFAFGKADRRLLAFSVRADWCTDVIGLGFFKKGMENGAVRIDGGRIRVQATFIHFAADGEEDLIACFSAFQHARILQYVYLKAQPTDIEDVTVDVSLHMIEITLIHAESAKPLLIQKQAVFKLSDGGLNHVTRKVFLAEIVVQALNIWGKSQERKKRKIIVGNHHRR